MKLKGLASSLVSLMPELTVQRSAARALDNAKQNLPYIKRTIRELTRRQDGAGPKAGIVISAGPSLHRRSPVRAIQQAGFGGEIIAADGALGYCLRNGLVPHYVVALDPHPTRVCRWFGDTDLELRPDDDYFRRQDLDPYVGIDERARNRELIELVNRHGPRTKLVISTSVSPNVTRRCLDAGMELYWWNPILDDVDAADSMTRALYRGNRVPCMGSGGNVGSAAWIFAHQVRAHREVALAGMDLGYAPGTPLEKTQYYKEIQALFPDRAEEAFIEIRNPHLNETWYTDPAYYWYRQLFLEMARDAPCATYNCSEGGILFGRGIRFVPLAQFLSHHPDGAREV